MIDLLPRGGSIHVDGGHSLPVVVLCCFVVVLPVFERGAVCVVPVLVSLIFSVHGGHSLPVVWMCVFHGGHSLPVVWMCVIFHGGHSLPIVRMCVCVWLMAVVIIACLLWNEPPIQKQADALGPDAYSNFYLTSNAMGANASIRNSPNLGCS